MNRMSRDMVCTSRSAEIVWRKTGDAAVARNGWAMAGPRMVRSMCFMLTGQRWMTGRRGLEISRKSIAGTAQGG